MKLLIKYLKHSIKRIIGKKDYKFEFYLLEKRINPETWKIRKDILRWGDESVKNFSSQQTESAPGIEVSPLVSLGNKLREDCLNHFHNKYSDEKKLRILIHVPAVNQTIAGYSLFSNLADGLEFLGIEVKKYFTGDALYEILDEFKPTLFLTSDNDVYITNLEWKTLNKYSADHPLKIGFTASLEEYGNTPLWLRLIRAETLGVNFFYSFRAKEFISNSAAYKSFYDFTQNIFSIEFGANPLIYYPVPNAGRDLNYVFLGSSNSAKGERYVKYFKRIFAQYSGFIDGPGWSSINDFEYNKNRDRFIYARGKAGLNLHVANQIVDASEINERTYILAMCGIPQVVDNPPLLKSRFSSDALFAAVNPDEYSSMFEFLLYHPEEGERKTLTALKEVFERHTSFHRAEQLIKDLKTITE